MARFNQNVVFRSYSPKQQLQTLKVWTRVSLLRMYQYHLGLLLSQVFKNSDFCLSSFFLVFVKKKSKDYLVP